MCTPLHYAAMYGYENIVKIIMDNRNKANLKLKNHQNMTAMDCSLNGNIYKHFNDGNN
jgi:ankyrin repeat protein